MAEHEAPSKGPVINDRLFDLLRRFVEFVFPALSGLYFGLNKFWGDAVFPNPENIAGTLALVSIFLAGLLAFLRNAYSKADTPPPGGYDGEVVAHTNDDGLPVLKFELDPKKVSDVLNKSQVTFKGFNPSA